MIDDSRFQKSRQAEYCRHVFRRYRFELRLLVVPIYILFGTLDYFYRPDLFWGWLVLRLGYGLFVFTGFELLKNKKIRARYFRAIAICTVVIANVFVNIMIWQSGGWSSLYVMGVILCATTGGNLFRLTRKDTLISNLGSYIPTVAICLYSGFSANQLSAAITVSAFLVGITVLEWVYKGSQYSVEQYRLRISKVLGDEIDRLRRSDFLKKHFPVQLRAEFEKAGLEAFRRKIIPSAVVGFADITASTTIGNSVNLMTDWKIKERFLECATRRATSAGMIVLTHVGDGFLFLANYEEGGDWPMNIIAFYEGLIRDFEQIRVDHVLELGQIETGIKLGVAMGPAIVGFIGQDQSYFTAMGPDVNLASRLCGKASNNEIVLGSRVWHVLRHILTGWQVTNEQYQDIKGFDHAVSAVRVSPRGLASNARMCSRCGLPLSVMKTPEGFIDFMCPNGHSAEVDSPISGSAGTAA